MDKNKDLIFGTNRERIVQEIKTFGNLLSIVWVTGDQFREERHLKDVSIDSRRGDMSIVMNIFDTDTEEEIMGKIEKAKLLIPTVKENKKYYLSIPNLYEYIRRNIQEKGDDNE